MVLLVYPTYKRKCVSLTLIQSVLKKGTFLDILATLGISWEHMRFICFIDSMPAPHLVEFPAEMLHFVLRLNRPD